MINRVVLVGRMTRDPELRRTSSGAAVTGFSLAINRNYQSASGEQQTDFINCVVWNKVAENVERYCSKGSLVGIEGRIQSRQYDVQDGTKRTVVEVVCDSVQFLETKNNNTQPAANGPIKRSDFDVNNSFDFLDDDIQF